MSVAEACVTVCVWVPGNAHVAGATVCMCVCVCVTEQWRGKEGLLGDTLFEHLVPLFP